MAFLWAFVKLLFFGFLWLVVVGLGITGVLMLWLMFTTARDARRESYEDDFYTWFFVTFFSLIGVGMILGCIFGIVPLSQKVGALAYEFFNILR